MKGEEGDKPECESGHGRVVWVREKPVQGRRNGHVKGPHGGGRTGDTRPAWAAPQAGSVRAGQGERWSSRRGEEIASSSELGTMERRVQHFHRRRRRSSRPLASSLPTIREVVLLGRVVTDSRKGVGRYASASSSDVCEGLFTYPVPRRSLRANLPNRERIACAARQRGNSSVHTIHIIS